MENHERHCGILPIWEDCATYMYEDSRIQDMSTAQTQHLMSSYVDHFKTSTSSASALLDRMRSINPEIASTFVVKENTLPELKLRLVAQDSKQSEIHSFLALSYSCPSQRALGIEVRSQQADGRFRLPISSCLGWALQEELQGDTEGIWCDQVCINQSDADERATTVNFTDALYYSARRTVVVIDDIVIPADEAEALLELGSRFEAQQAKEKEGSLTRFDLWQSPPVITRYPLVHKAYVRLIGSGYFSRTWCAHELRMCSRYIVLVRCSTAQGHVLRMSDAFLVYLNDLAAETADIPDSMTRDQFLASFSGIINSWNAKNRPQYVLDVWTGLRLLKAGGTPSLDPVLKWQSAIQDKLVVSMNMSLCGLGVAQHAYTESTTRRLPSATVMRRLMVLALASGHAIALCYSGYFIPRPRLGLLPLSWIQVPAENDKGHRRLPTVSVQATFNPTDIDEFIELPMYYQAGRVVVERPKEFFLLVATLFLEAMIDAPDQYEDQMFAYAWRSMLLTRELYLQTAMLFLACVFQCGTPWVLKSLQFDWRKEDWVNQFKEDTFKTFERTNLSLLDLNAHEKLEVSDETVARSIKSWFRDDATSKNAKFAEFLLQFIADIIEDVLHRRQDDEHMALFEPRIVRFSSSAESVMFLPSLPPDTIFAIPQCLTDDAFMNLKRIWLLEKITGQNGYRLIGKQSAIGPSLHAELSSHDTMRIRGPVEDKRIQTAKIELSHYDGGFMDGDNLCTEWSYLSHAAE